MNKKSEGENYFKNWNLFLSISSDMFTTFSHSDQIFVYPHGFIVVTSEMKNSLPPIYFITLKNI